MSDTHRRFKVPLVNRGAASICYLHYGNSQYAALIQETLAISKALEGYNTSVLLARHPVPAWAELGGYNGSHITCDLPTRTNLFNYLIQLTEAGYFIDLFLFTHGWREQFGAPEGRVGSDDRVTADDIESELHPSQTGFSQLPIRIVWGTNCYGQTLIETWRGVGARAIAGARYVNFYPNAWNNFIDQWNKGSVSFDDAVACAASASIRLAAQTYIDAIDAPARRRQGEWTNCTPGKTVLGDDRCARDYFVSCWLADDEWQAGLSGKENMNYSSHMFRGGAKDITSSTPLHYPQRGG